MKKLFFLGAMIAALVFSFSSCTKLEYVEFDDLSPVDDGVLKITVAGPDGLKSLTANGDTIPIEAGNLYNFSYSSTIEMTTIQWTFSNNGVTSLAATPNNFYERVFTISSVLLVGVDINGNAHQSTLWLNNLPRVAGDPIIWKSKTLLSTGVYRQEFYLYKNGAFMFPAEYKIRGNITTPSWQVLLIIPTVDTNYRLENNNLYTMPEGQNGHWVKVYLDSPANFDVEAAPLIRVSNDSGEQWASFKGSQFVDASNYGLMKYHVDADGNVSTNGGNTAEVPGSFGDNYLRFDIDQTNNNLIIYQNNEQAFSAIAAWIQFKENDSWATPLHATASVSGYSNWSQYQLSLSSLPKRARFGSTISNPVTNPNNALSQYFDAVYGDLYINIINP